MKILQEALNNYYCIISVMGDHALEPVKVIFDRKAADIKNIGRTFWLAISHKARPEQVQELCIYSPIYMIFVEPASKDGSRPTTCNDPAHYYSSNGQDWYYLPEGLGEVTGNLKRRPTALVFDKLTTSISGKINLWDYAYFKDEQKPIKFILGSSTACVIKKDMSLHPDRMKSNIREIVAVARLVEPFCVYLR